LRQLMVYVYILLITLISVLASLAVRRLQSDAKKEYLTTAFVLLVVGCVMTLIVCQSCHDSLSRFITVSTFFSIMWIALWLGNSYSADWFSARISWTEQPVKMFFVVFVFTIVYTLLAVYIILLFYRHVLGFKVEANNIIYSSLIITFLISMFMHGRSFLLGWKQSAIDAEKAKHESVTAKYESLKSQVNPHFLFNSLNALTNLVYENQDLAARFIKQLSEVYRYVLDTRDRELVSKEEEIRFLDSYIFLQKIRFEKNLIIQVDLAGVETSFPPLVLQMLIENAIKHNEISTDHPLSINIYREEEYIVVANNLQKKRSLTVDSPGIGLANITNRYEFLSNSKVVVAQRDGKFIVKLPLLNPD
jgi:sensor histidine kinase YesM